MTEHKPYRVTVRSLRRFKERYNLMAQEVAMLGWLVEQASQFIFVAIDPEVDKMLIGNTEDLIKNAEPNIQVAAFAGAKGIQISIPELNEARDEFITKLGDKKLISNARRLIHEGLNASNAGIIEPLLIALEKEAREIVVP